MYATPEDLQTALGEQRLIRIADRDDDRIPDEAVIRDALARASAEIDAALGVRYRLPLASVPERLRSLAIDLAHYHLDLDPTDDLGRRAKDARAALRAIASGAEALADATLASQGDGAADGGGQDLPAVRRFDSSLDVDAFR